MVKPLCLLLVFTGMMIILGVFKISQVSIKALAKEYASSRLIAVNVINLSFLYIAVPLFLYFADPLGIKYYTVGISAEVLAYYHLFLTHIYLAVLTGDHIIAAVLISFISDIFLFTACGLLALTMVKGRYAVFMNLALFYTSLIMLNFLSL